MMPGKFNSREMRRMMAQMGIKATEMPDVKRIIMEGGQKDYIIDGPQVTRIEAQGEITFQVTGKFKEVLKKPVQQAEASFPEDDVKLVMEQANVTREKAIEALKKSGGEPATAIVDLTS